MKIKFSVLAVLFCVFAVSTWANTTTDKLTVSGLTLNPGATTTDNDYITIGLDGSMLYEALTFDLYLPTGYEFAKDSYGQTAYLSTDGTMFNVARGGTIASHTIGYKIQEDGALRVAVYPSGADQSTAFKANSGALCDIYIKATPYAKPGEGEIKIKKSFLTYTDDTQYDLDDQVFGNKVSATTDVTLPVSISKTNQWSTFVSPIDTTLPGVKVYTCETADDDFAYLSTQTSVKAYVPYVVYAENGYSETLTGIADASKYPEGDYCEKGLLVGAYAPIEATAGKYVLQNHDGVVKFYKIAEEDVFTIPAGKCYLNPGTGTNSAKLAITVEDEADGINEVNANANADAIYDLQGRKVEHPQKNGIYIINGKTVIKK